MEISWSRFKSRWFPDEKTVGTLKVRSEESFKMQQSDKSIECHRKKLRHHNRMWSFNVCLFRVPEEHGRSMRHRQYLRAHC